MVAIDGPSGAFIGPKIEQSLKSAQSSEASKISEGSKIKTDAAANQQKVKVNPPGVGQKLDIKV